jgi:excinuclease ABC subunit A
VARCIRDFSRNYLCQPFNGGYYVVQALAKRYRFDPVTTPWNDMTPEARQAFIFGCDELLDVHYEGRTGITRDYQQQFTGFYGWIVDWDVGGTYTNTQPCPECGGARLRPEYLAVKLGGCNIHELSEMTLAELYDVTQSLNLSQPNNQLVAGATHRPATTAILQQVGLRYSTRTRGSDVCAGEAQRRWRVAGQQLTALPCCWMSRRSGCIRPRFPPCSARQ